MVFSSGSSWIEIVEGEAAGSRFDLSTDSILIGRGTRCQIQLEDPKASREHAQLQILEGLPVITDQGSTNGLYVNGEFTRHAPLSDGDKIRIGDTVLQLHLTPDSIPTVLDIERLGYIEEGTPSKPEAEPRSGASHCSSCGYAFSPGEKFCGSCGTKRSM